MRFCYQLIIIFSFCLTVTVISLSYGKIEGFFKSASSYLPLSLASQRETRLESKINKVPAKLSDLQFYSSYHVKGFLRLTTSDLHEPIEVWYSKEHNQSRIDYYGGKLSNLSVFSIKTWSNESEQSRIVYGGTFQALD
jgi:hypothetical protein